MTFMKYFFYLLLISSVIFCSNTKQGRDLKIEILNSYIYARQDLKNHHVRNVIRFDNYIYDSIPVNKINVKVTNSGPKAYVLFINKELDRVENLRYENIKLTVYQNGEVVQPRYLGYSINLTTKGFDYRKYENEEESDSLKQELNEKYLKEKINRDKIRFQRETNYVVIHPGETKFFSFYRTLPVFLEHVSSYYQYDFKKDEQYYFQISLKNDAEKLRKYFSINQVKEIEENNYTIFDGTIKSNKIPVKFVSMPK